MVTLTLLTGLLFLSILFRISFVHAWDANNPESLKDYVIFASSNEGVNVGMALAIAKAESGFNPNAHNPVGTASGVFQFLNSTFQHQCIDTFHLTDTMANKDNPFIQINCAIEMLKQPLGYQHWWASHDSWGKYLVS